MASAVAKTCSTSNSSSLSYVSPVITVQEKVSRNKRKFRADPPPLTDLKISSLSHNECLTYEFSAESFMSHEHSNSCDMCSFGCEDTDHVELDLGLSCSVGPSHNRVEIETSDEFHDADWSDLTESQLEELVLANLDTIFRSAINKIVSFGYTKEVATKGVLKSGLCYGCNDAVSNIVNNTLGYLKSGQEVDSLREHNFEDLKQMEKYILAELVCVVREVRPFFSTGDAMWCLLISDMNVSNACTLDTETLNSLVGDGVGSSNSCVSDSSETQLKKESTITSNTKIPYKPKAPFVLNKFALEKENLNSTHRMVIKSQNHEEKVVGGRKVIGINKRESIIRQKSVHLEKSYRAYGSKGVSRSGKVTNFKGLLLDKKLKSVSESTGINLKNISIKVTKGARVAPSQVDITEKEPTKHTVPLKLTPDITELSLSQLPKQNVTPVPDVTKPSFSAISYDKSFGHAKKDEIVMKLGSRVHELQTQMQEWTEWANQKVMQAARRLGKDKTELKTLRSEKEEVERLKKEKQTLEDNTMKKLSEMENALCKASGQVERANSAVRRLKVENGSLRREMEAANLRAAESAASCQEVAKREKKTLVQFQSWEKLKTLFQEELIAEKSKLTQLRQELEVAKDQKDQLETRWKQEEKAKEELVSQANSFRIGRLQAESSGKLREDLTKLKADKSLQRYKQDIEKLEKEISFLSLKTDSLKIAALRGEVNGSYSSKLADIKTSTAQHESHGPFVPKMVNDVNGGVKRERECVMCLSEEMSVVFLPCAHQGVCKTCNELHEKQGMKDCPSCRGTIERRICVRYARS
ncbi:putative E3 ubiquitin-protein ligase RF298 [Rutidosis leptorrhynchoides]|uniref:putative E3 ubiquitin-protein ligase RF298 n=1 Tax=Rutidosis leptorrhynchoides TaxID=125765 RepID=UPI003A994DE8